MAIFFGGANRSAKLERRARTLTRLRAFRADSTSPHGGEEKSCMSDDMRSHPP